MQISKITKKTKKAKNRIKKNINRNNDKIM